MLEIFRKRKKLSEEASVPSCPQTTIVHKSYNVDIALLNKWRKENEMN